MAAGKKARALTYRDVVALRVRGVGLLVLFETVTFGLRSKGRGELDGVGAHVLTGAVPLGLALAISLVLLVRSRALAASLFPVDRPATPSQVLQTRRLIMFILCFWFFTTAVLQALPLANVGIAGATPAEDGPIGFLMRTQVWDVIAVLFRVVVGCAGLLGLIELSNAPKAASSPAAPAAPAPQPLQSGARERPAPLEPE